MSTDSIEHKHGNTIARDEEGETRFVLPGTHDRVLVQHVQRLIEQAEARGAEWGRAALQRDLRRMLGVHVEPAQEAP